MIINIIRHPGESRDPGFQPAHKWKVWVPTYVGMTEKEMFAGMAEHSLELQGALREMKLKKMGESESGSRRNDDEGDAIQLNLIRRRAD